MILCDREEYVYKLFIACFCVKAEELIHYGRNAMVRYLFKVTIYGTIPETSKGGRERVYFKGYICKTKTRRRKKERSPVARLLSLTS